MLDAINLIRVNTATDSSGTQVINVSGQRIVLCEIQSIGMRESYQALAINRNPEIKAVLADAADYDGEQYATRNGITYKVLRCYQAERRLELTLERTSDLKGLV